VEELRGGLAALGVGRGDRVGIVADNRVEWAAAAFATYGLGAVFVPMYQAQPPKEWAFILRDCEAKVVFGANQQVYDDLKQVAQEVPSLQHVIGLELPESDADSYRRLLEVGRKQPAAPAQLSGSDLAALIYTSGTTGSPKGVRLGHGNFCSNVLAASQRFDFGPGDRSLAFLPWAHSFGQTAELYTLLWKRSEEHTSELQSRENLVCRLLLE